jgi:3-dehydroquinate synthase
VTVVRVDLGDRGYDVVVEEGALARVGEILGDRRRVAIVTQRPLDERYAPAVRASLDRAGVAHTTVHMGDGEAHKTLGTVEDLCRALATWGLRRGDALVALGGGVVGDVAGFTAAVYYRGVDVVQVPTTLLAMVDSAIGGKTGVNLPEGKNLVGAFHQPVAVLAATEVLTSLPDSEYRCGLGEVAKYALLDDDFVRGQEQRLLDRDPDVVAATVARCAEIKAAYVAADELELSGTRAALNYGHTLAHALETVSRHALAHGEAVAIGLVFAGNLAGALERIDPAAVARHEELVGALGLPVRAPAGLAVAELFEVMVRDKKSGGGLTFVLPGPNGIERVDDPDPAALAKAFAAVGVEA